MPQSLNAHNALHVANVKRTTPRIDSPFIPQPQPAPFSFHADRPSQMVAGCVVLLFILLVALPLYAFLTR